MGAKWDSQRFSWAQKRSNELKGTLKDIQSRAQKSFGEIWTHWDIKGSHKG